jgi:hypothetical protein
MRYESRHTPVLLLLLAAATAHATTRANIVHRHVEAFRCPGGDLADTELIDGVVTGSSVERSAEHDWVITWFEIRSPAAQAPRRLGIPGGWLDEDRFLQVSGHPLLTPGDQVLLLGQRTKNGGFRVVDGERSFFVATADASARTWTAPVGADGSGGEDAIGRWTAWLAGSREPAMAALVAGVHEKCGIEPHRGGPPLSDERTDDTGGVPQ